MLTQAKCRLEACQKLAQTQCVYILCCIVTNASTKKNKNKKVSNLGWIYAHSEAERKLLLVCICAYFIRNSQHHAISIICCWFIKYLFIKLYYSYRQIFSLTVISGKLQRTGVSEFTWPLKVQPLFQEFSQRLHRQCKQNAVCFLVLANRAIFV